MIKNEVYVDISKTILSPMKRHSRLFVAIVRKMNTMLDNAGH